MSKPPTSAASATLSLSVQYAAAPPPLPRSMVRALVRAALAAGGGGTRGEITVRFVDEAESAALNGRYRKKPRPTNVLSFDYRDDARAAALGDIVICDAVVRREADDNNITPAARAAHMIVHGVLHLIGHRHDTDAAAAAMEALEQQVLSRFNMPSSSDE